MSEKKMPAMIPEAGMLPPAVSHRGRGPVTGIDLGDLDALRQPFCQDPFFRLRPPLRQEALLLSLELAAMAYRLEVNDWMDAGWRDFSIQIDNQLQTGQDRRPLSYRLSPLSIDRRKARHEKAARPQARAKSTLWERNPIQQVLGALRQRERSDTIKAVTLLRRQRDGRNIVAIGFMGTGSRFYDWFSNFRFTPEEGFHRGFAQLTDVFERSAERIVFPDTAAEMGLETLTLADILEEMRSLNSRFFLWMAGHSQGAAVMQVFCHRLMEDWRVLPQNMLGYGFASPTVATGQFVYDPARYPLYHVLNSDDVVPRLGALLHLGLCLEYRATSAIRDACYGWSGEEADAAPREALEPFLLRMTDTPGAMEICVAFCYCLLEEKAEEHLNVLMDRKWTIAPIEKVLSYAGNKAQDVIEAFARHTRNGYRALVGQGMDGDRIAALKEDIRPVVRQYTLRQLLSALHSLVTPPHTLAARPPMPSGAYSYIAMEGFRGLRPCIWVKQRGSLPIRQFAEGAPWNGGFRPVPSFRKPAIRRRKPVAASLKGPVGRGISALRSGHGAARGQPRKLAMRR